MTMTMLILAVDSKTDEVGAGDVANERAGFGSIGGQFGVLRNIKGNYDSSVLDVIRVGDVGVTAEKRRMDANASPLIGQGELHGGGGILERHADDCVKLPVTANMMPGKEETAEANDEDEGQEPLDRTANGALLPLVASRRALATAESAPEARFRSADNELDVGFVQDVDGVVCRGSLLDWEFRHKWGGGHWEVVYSGKL